MDDSQSPDQSEKSVVPNDYFLNPGECCEEDFQEAFFSGPLEYSKYEI